MLLVFVLMGIIVLLAEIYENNNKMDFSLYNNAGQSHEVGRVVKLVSEDLSLDKTSSLHIGSQILMVEILSGDLRGEIVRIDNQLSVSQNTYAKEGDELSIIIETPKNAAPMYYVYNYHRIDKIYILIILFTVLMLIFGRQKGFFSLIGLIFSLFFIIKFLLPYIFNGGSVVIGSLISSILLCFICLSLLNGFSKKTFIAFASTSLALIISIVVYFLVSKYLNMDGYKLGEVEELIVLSEIKGLKLKDLLFSGVIISSLGAIMDMCMSITTSLFEIEDKAKLIDSKTLIKSGFELGKDMTGTMTETLIFAFFGTGLITMLLLPMTGVDKYQLLNSNYLAEEVIYGLIGAVGVLISVPITVFSYVIYRSFRLKLSKPNSERRKIPAAKS